MAKPPSATALAAVLASGLRLSFLLALSRPSAIGAFRPTIFRPLACPPPGRRPLRLSSSVVPPELPSNGERDGATAPYLLCGGTGLVAGLGMACTLPALSWGWLCSFLVLILSSYAIARSTLPFATEGKGIDIPDDMYARNFSAHIFSATAIPIMTSLMWPLFQRAAQKGTFLLSMLFVTAGSAAEIYAHFKDSWVFDGECSALLGWENAVFFMGLTGGFSFLAATFSASPLSVSLAGAPVAFLAYRAATRPWPETRGLAVAANSVSSVTATAVLIQRFRSTWPLLFFTQSFNIIRNANRLVGTGKQSLHVLPAVYGSFSYVVPFALSQHPATRAASVWTVMGACALSFAGTDFLERNIIKHG